MAEVDPRVAAEVARLPEVRAAVLDLAHTISARAETLLSQHNRTGRARIEVTRGGTDAFVSLVDSAALSIEYGHFTRRGTDAHVTYVPGLFIITRAADL